MTRYLGWLLLAPALLLAGPALAWQAGLRQLRVEGAGTDSPAITVALYYPTEAPARAIVMGPFTANVAMQGPPPASVKGLIVLSHGTGGSELAQGSLAEALARSGYLVAAVRHPGDNWQDTSIWKKWPELYFAERPRQVSRVIDALLRDPLWQDRIARDARGPRIGAVGHSAGGYTVLALAGGEPDLGRIATHCQAERADDPVFCGRGPKEQAALLALRPTPISGLADRRVRAVVALAPVAVVFTPESLAAIGIPVAVYEAALDRSLVPRFHTAWVAVNLPRAQFHSVPKASHFAFVDTPSMAIPTDDGDLRADPPGFDRAAFLKQLAIDIPAFFDAALE